jgi:hypothetical protein
MAHAHEQLAGQVHSLEQQDKEQAAKVSQAASKQAVELLAVVVEEQRLRTDSIIQGSVKIKPLSKDLRKLETEMQRLSDQLSLSPGKQLQRALDDLHHQVQGTVSHPSLLLFS